MDITEPSGKVVNFVSISPRAASVLIGANYGFRKVSLHDLYGRIKISYDNFKDVYIVELYELGDPFNQIAAVVSSSSPSKVYVFNISKNQREPCQEFTFPGEILSLKSLYDFYVACLGNSLCIRCGGEIIKIIRLPFPSYTGMFSLAEKYLAYPQKGSVELICLKDLTPKQTIKAHKSDIVAMTLTEIGDQIATASESGHTIRLFDTVSGRKLKEFTYGTGSEIMYSLSFSSKLKNKYIISSSNEQIIRVFKIGSTEFSTSDGEITEESAFATVNLEISKQRTFSALGDGKIVVVSFEGVVYVYEFNSLQAQECKLLSEYNLHSNSGGCAENTEKTPK